MTQEDKDLLLRDLCARLPYTPIIKIEEHNWNNMHIDAYDTPFKSYYLEPFIIGEIEIIPYLRPMSSMTEEEEKEFLSKIGADEIDKMEYLKALSDYKFFYLKYFHRGEIDNKNNKCVYLSPRQLFESIDWLNAHHFDYRGLIEKGLALEAPEGMY